MYIKAYYNRGLARVHLNSSKAIQDFNRSLAIDPNLFESFLARACAYAQQGRVSKAILNCNEAIRLNPKSVRAYLYR
jgi:tetratricopeptide (TPR) repeat protein